MWIVSTLGFFSIVQKPEDKASGTLTVRARVRSDLDALREAVLPALGPIGTSATTDYRYRAQAPHAAVTAAMARLIADVDYSNFKSAVAKRQGAKRENLYHGVWDVLHKLQGNAAFERPGQSSRSKVATDPAPKVAQANAYGGVLVDTNGLVLLREPTNHFGGYVWTFPKGRPDAGESPAEAALREVREETGYNARIICPIVGVFGGTTSTTAFFLMEPISEQGPTESETSQTRWVSFKDAPDLIAKTTVKAGRDRDLAVLNAAQKALAELPGR